MVGATSAAAAAPAAGGASPLCSPLCSRQLSSPPRPPTGLPPRASASRSSRTASSVSRTCCIACCACCIACGSAAGPEPVSSPHSPTSASPSCGREADLPRDAARDTRRDVAGDAAREAWRLACRDIDCDREPPRLRPRPCGPEPVASRLTRLRLAAPDSDTTGDAAPLRAGDRSGLAHLDAPPPAGAAAEGEGNSAKHSTFRLRACAPPWWRARWPQPAAAAALMAVRDYSDVAAGLSKGRPFGRKGQKREEVAQLPAELPLGRGDVTRTADGELLNRRAK
eukprot:366488-Chlamydomonas_euryale.AAC.17